MRTAKPNELKEAAFPVMTARLTEKELSKWFPVSFEDITDPWAAPEPSKGALVRLDAGEYVVLDYGRDSQQLIIRIPADLDPSSFLASFFREVPLPRSRVLWHRAGARMPRVVAAKQMRMRTATRRSTKSSRNNGHESKK